MPDKRKHIRIKAHKETIAVSAGNIARIIDVSEGGMALKFIDITDIPKSFFLDLFLRESGLYIEQIPVKLAWKKDDAIPTFAQRSITRIGIEFDKLSHFQQNQIDEFILKHSEGVA